MTLLRLKPQKPYQANKNPSYRIKIASKALQELSEEINQKGVQESPIAEPAAEGLGSASQAQGLLRYGEV